MVRLAGRLTSFKSRLQLSLFIFLYRQFGFKNIRYYLNVLDILSSLTESYNETVMYEAAAVYHVFTIDDHNTVHIMGIIQITSSSEIIAKQPIKKFSNMPSAKVIAADHCKGYCCWIDHLPIQIYKNYGVSDLKKILFENIIHDDKTTVLCSEKQIYYRCMENRYIIDIWKIEL